MSEREHIFVVIDPANDEHPALQRALFTAKVHERRPLLKLFFAVDHQSVRTDTDRANLQRDRDWFQQLCARVEAAGLEYSCDISWSSSWHEPILQAAEQFGADMLLIPLRARSAGERVIVSEAKWSLLRNAHCGVLMVKPGAKESRDVVLAAMKVSTTSDEYSELNEKIGARARWLAERYAAELHVVTACSDINDYPDRARIIELTGVKNENIHVELGKVDVVIPEVAKRLQADIVVVGTMARKGLSAVMRGNTSEKIISLLERDVMTLC